MQQASVIDTHLLAQIRKYFELCTNNSGDRVLYYPSAVSVGKPTDCQLSSNLELSQEQLIC